MAAVGAPPAGLRKMFRISDGNVSSWEGEGTPAGKTGA